MAPGAWARFVRWLDGHAVGLWAAAVAFFLGTDLLTTAVGYRAAGVAEAGPLTGSLLGRYGVLALVPLKAVVIGVGYLAWRVLPRLAAVGAPLGLATVGLVATLWNVAVLASASL
jgi:hypothetical protein